MGRQVSLCHTFLADFPDINAADDPESVIVSYAKRLDVDKWPLAQVITDSPFTIPAAKCVFYTGWNTVRPDREFETCNAVPSRSG